MAEKEAKARIKTNRLLEEAGWCFFDDETGSANIRFSKQNQVLSAGLNEFFQPKTLLFKLISYKTVISFLGRQ